MGRYVCVEIGKVAYTEFMMKDGNFENTEDGIFLGVVDAQDEGEAIENIKKLDYNKDRLFDDVIAYKLES